MDKDSWCLNSDGTVRSDNVELYHLAPAPRESPTDELLVSTESPTHTENEKIENEKKDVSAAAVMPLEGDTIGVAYDHVELNFFLNGKNMEIPVRNIKGTVYPALYGKQKNVLFFKILEDKLELKVPDNKDQRLEKIKQNIFESSAKCCW